MTDAANAAAVPVDVLDIARSSAPDVYRHKLLLARPDQHVAWRSDTVPDDPGALIDTIRGAISIN